MTEQEIKVWAAVYAAVMQGLVANPDCRLNWNDIRDRAETEASAAVRTLRKEVA